MIRGSRAARRPTFFLALALGIIWSAAAPAKTTAIDDSGTTALEPSVGLRWRSAAPPRSGSDNLMIGTATIRVRINVMPWLKRSGRIYLSLPAQQPGPVSASWIAQGRFMPGQVRSGNRVLIYAGPITTPFMEDVLQFQFSVDGTLVRRAFPLSFHFEMDED
jgi:predicted small secreted protein